MFLTFIPLIFRLEFGKSKGDYSLGENGLEDLPLYFLESGVDVLIIDLTLTYDSFDRFDATDFGETDLFYMLLSAVLFDDCLCC